MFLVDADVEKRLRGTAAAFGAVELHVHAPFDDIQCEQRLTAVPYDGQLLGALQSSAFENPMTIIIGDGATEKISRNYKACVASLRKARDGLS